MKKESSGLFKYNPSSPESPVVAPTDLARVVKLAELLVKRTADLAAKQAEADVIKEEVSRLEREDLPALMAEIGITDVGLKDGRRVSIKKDFDCGISKANKEKAFAWLVNHKFGGIIKVLVAVQFGKGEREAATKIAAELQKMYRDKTIQLDEGVHPATLKSFVKERMEAGEPVPPDLFGVFTFNKAVITAAK